jgi:flagellum-specific peptidoglycan hydrolase FlgJ
MTSIIALSLFILAGVSHGALGAQWGCHGTKPGHPTADERVAFVREVSQLAVKAEKKHGVPASVLAAMAIAESGYGWTRVALQANNLFGWKAGPEAIAEGSKVYLPSCPRNRRSKTQYLAFKSRAEAFDLVAGKLATLPAYREHTEAYNAARKRGGAIDRDAKAWLSGIAKRYSAKPSAFTRKIIRIMNNPLEPADRVSPEHNLYRLSKR